MRALSPSVGLLLLASCATLPTQTKYMEEQGLKVSSSALRMRLRAEAVPFTGLVEQTADEIAAASSDPAVRRRALVWKINLVPALYRTLFMQQPLLALLDTWALLLQAEQYLESDEGKRAFGPGSAEMLATARELERQVLEIAAWAAPDRDLATVGATLRNWAAKHPVKLTFATRESIVQYAATAAPAEGLSAFAAVGALNEDVDGMISRMDFLPIMVPRQATWQAELVYVDMVDPRLEVALNRGGQALDKIDDMLTWLGTQGLDGFAEQQRIQIMRALSAEMVEVEKLIGRQREEAQAFVESERKALLEQVRQERIAAMADAQKLADHAAEEGARRVQEVIDHLLLRTALILAALLVLAMAGAYLLRRGDRPPSAPRT